MKLLNKLQVIRPSIYNTLIGEAQAIAVERDKELPGEGVGYVCLGIDNLWEARGEHYKYDKAIYEVNSSGEIAVKKECR